MDLLTTTPTPLPAPPAKPHGFRALWLAYQQHVAADHFVIGIHAWPFLDWRTASGLQWRTRINRPGGQ